ncbi:hypothetical protein QBC35DRAFT_537740, partial [Podospora australis]
MRWMNLFKRAQHMIQPVRLSDQVFSGIPSFYPVPAGYCTTIEFAKRGDLDGFAEKSRGYMAGPEPMTGLWPNSVLWLIAECLMRACVAMAYPPSALAKARGDNWDSDDEEPIQERIPGQYDFVDRETPAPSRIVHHDIDAWNIFVFDVDQMMGDPHDSHPVVKLADFGLMNDHRANPRGAGGKDGYHAPDAHAYSSASNVFQMAHVLYYLITG